MVKVRVGLPVLLCPDVVIRLVEGEWTDDDIKDPIEEILNLLNNSKNRSLTQKWGLWLTRRDPERGIKAGQDIHVSARC